MQYKKKLKLAANACVNFSVSFKLLKTEKLCLGCMADNNDLSWEIIPPAPWHLIPGLQEVVL